MMIGRFVAVVFAAGLGLAAAGPPPPPPAGSKGPDGCSSIVGAWYVDAVGAPFAPHAATFHADSTVVMTNPDAAEAANSSSAGMGAWKQVRGCGFALQFLEVNADRSSNRFSGTLVVAGQVSTAGDTFAGAVTASYYDGGGVLIAGPFPAVLKGQRITVGAAAPHAAS